MYFGRGEGEGGPATGITYVARKCEFLRRWGQFGPPPLLYTNGFEEQDRMLTLGHHFLLTFC